MPTDPPPKNAKSRPPPAGVVGIPIRDFRRAKTRLANHLEPAFRERLMRAVAGRVVAASLALGAETVVVTADRAVAEWAVTMGAGVVAEPTGGGLDGAAEVAARRACDRSEPWCIAHADLPLVDADHIGAALQFAAGGGWAIAPSRVGGTNLLAGRSPMRFRYGPASFHRHLAETTDLPRLVLVTTATALDLDTVDDLVGAASLPGGEWLAEFLAP